MESKAGAGSGDSEGGEAGGVGRANPIGVVAHGFSNFQSNEWTITSAGTTWIDTTADGQVGTDWTIFPWEFPQLFMSNNERVDLYNDYLFWKCSSVTVTFKNFRGFVNTIPPGGTTTQTYPTDNAAFQTYRDEMYYLGPQLHPFINSTGWITAAALTTMIQSWQKGGFDGTTRTTLPVFDIPVNGQFENMISQNYPNVTQTLGIPTETVSHTWHTSGDRYWRCTSEFVDGMNDPTKDPAGTKIWPTGIRPFRADQFGGYVLSGSQNMILERPVFNGVTDTITANVFGVIPPTCYSTAEPIPPLLLRIVPQHIDGGGNSTHLQLDFEITFRIKVRGQIPRHGFTNDSLLSRASANPTGANQGLNRPGSRTPALPYYPSGVTTANLPTILPLNGQNIQRGRTKNGFVFIPYTGWETSITTTAPGPAPTAADGSMSSIFARTHAGRITDPTEIIVFLHNTNTSAQTPIHILDFINLLDTEGRTLATTDDAATTITYESAIYNEVEIWYPPGQSNTQATRLYFTAQPIPVPTTAKSDRITDAESFKRYLHTVMQAHTGGSRWEEGSSSPCGSTKFRKVHTDKGIQRKAAP